MAPELTRTARRRRVWCETLPYEALASREVCDLLARYDLEVLVAVTPALRPGAARVFRTLADRGIHAALWPMIDDAEGRWASAATLPRYVAFVDDLTAELARANVTVDEVAIDLEPPFAAAKAASHGAWLGPVRTALALREDFRTASTSLRSFVDRLGEATRVSCAAVPLVLLDEAEKLSGGPGISDVSSTERPFFQALLGTPVDGVQFGSVSIMAYTTILEGWSRGVLDRRASVGVLGECARLARGRYASRASISLGTVGVGAFTDEPIYRSPIELVEDVAMARANGVDDLSLFDLGGIVRRGPPEAWLEAFVSDEGPLVALPRRVRLGSACLRALARVRIP